MKFFHTADWHLGKLVQGVYMTEDQRYILDAFSKAVEEEKPDAVIIAGDLYDRAVPPTEAVQLLDDVLGHIVMGLKIPVLAVAGNHDSPSRLDFGSTLMKSNGYHITGIYTGEDRPVVLKDEAGEVHFHLVPYCDPSVVRHRLGDETIRTHNDAMKKIVEHIKAGMDPEARHVLVGHAFVTPFGESEDNTSDSERPLSIGGAEHVDAHHFAPFDYTALGHLHQAHHVLNETVRYAGSILKYSASEAAHKKGYFIVELAADGTVEVEKRLLHPRRDIRIIEAEMAELLTHPKSDDYVFVRLLDASPVLSPMERIRSVYPNAMHVERKHAYLRPEGETDELHIAPSQMNDLDRFRAFYREVKGDSPGVEAEDLFKEILDDMLRQENETVSTGLRPVVK